MQTIDDNAWAAIMMLIHGINHQNHLIDESNAKILKLRKRGYNVLKTAGINHDTLPKQGDYDDAETEIVDLIYAWWL